MKIIATAVDTNIEGIKSQDDLLVNMYVVIPSDYEDIACRMCIISMRGVTTHEFF